MKTILSVLITVCMLNNLFGQRNYFEPTKCKNIFYHYDQHDSTVIFQIYHNTAENYIGAEAEFTIRIDELLDVYLTDIPYCFDDNSYIFQLPKECFNSMICSRNIDIYAEFREIGDMDSHIIASYEKCLTERDFKE